MLARIKNGIARLSTTAEQLAKRVNTYLGPALKAGKIVAGIYSVYATTVLIGCGIMGYSLSWLTEYPGADLVMEILAMVSMITLVLSGSILEAFQILLLGLECGASLASGFAGSWIGFAISAILFVIPLFIAVAVILCAPIVPILIHWYRTEHMSVS